MRAMAGCVSFITLRVFLIADAAFQAHIPVPGGFHQIGQPVNQLAGMIDPYFYQIAVHIAAAVTDNILQSFCLIDFKLRKFLKGFQLQFGIDASDVFTDSGGRLAFFYDENFSTFFCRRHGSNPAAGTTPDYQDFGFQRLGDVTLNNFRCLAEPVGSVCLLLFQHNFFAGRLRNTVSCCSFHSIRCNRCTGNGVYIRGLPAENGLCHLITDFTANVGSFTGYINLNVGNGTAVKRHSDFDIA